MPTERLSVFLPVSLGGKLIYISFDNNEIDASYHKISYNGINFSRTYMSPPSQYPITMHTKQPWKRVFQQIRHTAENDNLKTKNNGRKEKAISYNETKYK